MASLWAFESTLPFKTAFHNSWETAQLPKMLCDNSPLTVQQFGYNIVSPKFPAAFSFLNLLEAPSLFGDYFIFFLWFLKNRAFDYFSQFKCCVRASNYFSCFNGITANLTEERDRKNMSNGLNLVYARCYSTTIVQSSWTQRQSRETVVRTSI